MILFRQIQSVFGMFVHKIVAINDEQQQSFFYFFVCFSFFQSVFIISSTTISLNFFAYTLFNLGIQESVVQI